LATVGALVAAVAVGVGITVAVHHRPTTGGPQLDPASVAPAAAGSTTGPVDIVPGPDQAFLTGTVTTLSADNAIGPPLVPPFTITIAARGQGSADFTGVAVGGQDVQIFWYGGQPLPMSGTGTLAIDGGALTVDRAGSTWMLDGAARSLTTGHFTLGAPVAVGSGGLAQAHQSIAFDAGDRSTVLTTGQAQVHLAPAPLRVTGPGKLTIHGDLQLQTAGGTRHVMTVGFGPGSYAVDLTPDASGDSINATLQGPVSAT
jgi:hypothetical protein